MLRAATLWHPLVQLSASADLCFAIFWKGSKQRSPITGSFVQSTKASRDWKDRKSESTREKGLWFGDRWGVFIWLQRLHEAFGLSFGSLVALSVVEAKHVMCLGSYLNPSPAVSNKRSKQLYFLQVWPNMSMAIFFPPILRISPSFPRPLQHSFLLVALLCTQRPVVFMWKKLGSFAPFLFVERCVLGISMATHIGGHANPAFRLCGFWHHVFVLLLSDVERLWLNHATTNLIREANRISVCRSSVSLGIWIMRKERFNHKSVRTAINNYEKKKNSLTVCCRDARLWRIYSILFIECWQ